MAAKTGKLIAKQKVYLVIVVIFGYCLRAKGYYRNICFNEGLFVIAILTIALLSENSTNSLIVETRSDRYIL